MQVSMLPGQLGHLAVIIAFISSGLASWYYFVNATTAAPLKANSGVSNTLANFLVYLHFGAVVTIGSTLFYIIQNHLYEYHYAWSHSNNNLAVEYMISCFWEGQEGSFLLWMFWHSVIAVLLTTTLKPIWKAPVMGVFMLVQFFLCTMILGVEILGVKLGSSPFILMKEAMPNLPVYVLRPDFIAEDGRGLNPLLQNYWMVIHPPTLFLGFALTLVPFAFAMGSVINKQYTQWVKPVLPWVLTGAMVLGVGIMMGAYWAYETLNFGGYWNWDPVENAVYIPWLVLVGSIHTLIAYKKKGMALKASYILVVTSFLLVLYATFLTRSGILGDSSVHSFTDLGLSGQLLVYLLFFVVTAIVLLYINWKNIPSTDSELGVYSKEFWVFIAATVLGLAAFQVLVTTSIPVFNAIVGLVGVKSKMAPPANPIAHYSNWQLWFGAAIAIASATGQYIWWRQNKNFSYWKAISYPFIVSLMATSAMIIIWKVSDIPYLALLTASIYGVVGNLFIVIHLLKLRASLAGGAVAHIGISVMLIGILFSAGYSKVLSINTSGMVYRKEFKEDMNRDNLLLFRGTTQTMADYQLTYLGDCKRVIGFPIVVKKEYLRPTDDAYRNVCRDSLVYDGKTYYHAGDTVKIEPENTYYAVEYKNDSLKQRFVLFPRAQVNQNMGLLASPSIAKFWDRDYYTHVSAIIPPEQEKNWGKLEEQTMVMGDTFIANDFICQLVSVERINQVEGEKLGVNDAAIKAVIRVFGKGQNYIASPVFAIKDKMVGQVPYELGELGLRFTLTNINPEKQTFTIGVNATQKDWVILKVVEKPLINLVWIGVLITTLGFIISLYRRIRNNLEAPILR